MTSQFKMTLLFIVFIISATLQCITGNSLIGTMDLAFNQLNKNEGNSFVIGVISPGAQPTLGPAGVHNGVNSSETACERVLVHGNRMQTEFMGIYNLEEDLVEGYPAYHHFSNTQIRYASGQWVIGEKGRTWTIGQVQKGDEDYPYNNKGVWRMNDYGGFWGQVDVPEFKIECMPPDPNLWARTGLCFENIINDLATYTHTTGLQECLAICASSPRCVSISISRNGCWPHHKLCLEVKVIRHEGSGFNIHIGKLSKILENKDIYQSSTNSEWGGDKEKAVDGIYLSNLVTGLSCSLTQDEPNSWWAADLGALYHITGYAILPRTECCFQSLLSVIVGGEETSDVTSTIGRLTAKDFSMVKQCGGLDFVLANENDKVLFKCEQPRVMRTFIIYRSDPTDNTPLSICEIELIGQKAGRYGYFFNKVTQEEATAICQDSFDNGTLLQFTSNEEMVGFQKYLNDQQLRSSFWIGDSTSPASRNIASDTIYSHGEPVANAAIENFAVTCEASSEKTGFECENVFDADELTPWIASESAVGSWIKITLRYYYHIYRLMLLQRFHKDRSYSAVDLEFSEGETYQMPLTRRSGLTDSDANGKYYDSMDFSGFLSNSIKITVSSVYNEDDNGFNEIKVYSKPRGIMFLAGSCPATTISVLNAGIAECEVACLNNLDCKAGTVTALSETSFLCELKDSPCTTLQAVPLTTTFIVKDENSGYNMISETDACSGPEASYVSGENGISVDECMMLCENEPSCDYLVYCVSDDCLGMCDMYHGKCTEKGYYTTLLYERRGGYYNRNATTYVGCYDVPEQYEMDTWPMNSENIELVPMLDEKCRAYCSVFNHTFFALYDGEECLCGSSYGDTAENIDGCQASCSYNWGSACGGYESASIRLVEPVQSYCMSATSDLPYPNSPIVPLLEFREEICQKQMPFICVRNHDHCSSGPCKNGGSCSSDAFHFNCSCAAGYTGSACETDIDDCAVSQCLNGGSCLDLVDDFLCVCENGYTGDLCETNIDDCQPDPCSNGAACVDGVDEFACNCVAGYTGPLCETEIDECLSSPCGIFGECTDAFNNYICSCFGGFEGDSCEIETDECASNPCLNGGSCLDKVNSYVCQCPSGLYEGLHCEIEVDNCVGDFCFNNATCQSIPFGHTCQCSPGFTGLECETNIDECSSLPCENGGTCHDGINSYECECGVGFDGEVCSGFIGNPGTWESWSDWSSCSHSCGKGLQSRSRNCSGLFDLPEVGPPDCGNGDYTELQFCNSAPCPAVDGNWGEWKPFGGCSDCGMSTQLMFRECDTPKAQNGGLDCPGANETTLGCFKYCGNGGEAVTVCSEWEQWSTCTGSCPSGSQSRKRSCALNVTDSQGSTTSVRTSDEDSRVCLPSGCSGLQCYTCDYKYDGSGLASACTSSTQCGGSQDHCMFEYNLGSGGSVSAKARCGSANECDGSNLGSPCSSLLSLGSGANSDEIIAALSNLNDSCKVCCNSQLCNKGWHIEAAPYFRSNGASELKISLIFLFSIFAIVS